MAGLPKQYAKMGFKKGWAAFRKAHGSTKKRKSSSKKGSSRKSSSSPVDLSGIKFPQIAKSSKRRSGGNRSKTDKILAGVGEISMDLGLLVAGMVGAAQIKKITPVKNMLAMNLITFGIGAVGAVLARKKYIRVPMMGIAASAFISQVKTTFPKLPISGDEDFVYLPPNVAGEEFPQIEYAGDDRIGEVIEGEDGEQYVMGDDGEYVSVNEVIEGEEDPVYGFDDDMMG